MSRDVSDLKNLGPKSCAQLSDIGIYTADDLARTGTEAVFEKLFHRFESEFTFSSVYLYALEGALLDIDWRDIPEARKQELTSFFASLKR